MSEKEYFQNALSNFAFDVASGGLIRHLADQGYAVSQIMERLDFPVSYEKVQRTVWEHLLASHVLLLEEPDKSCLAEKETYVEDHGKYGRMSFRRVVVPAQNSEGLMWRERTYGEADSKDLAGYVSERCAIDGEENGYVSCDFGLVCRTKPDTYALWLSILDNRQRDYLEGIPWTAKRVYHRLNQRMREILYSLWDTGDYHGICYFTKSCERVLF